jgi:phosphoribosylanthranilate isomerase
MSVKAKICGVNGPAAVTAAVSGGAGFIGFVFYAPSPRAVTPEAAAALAAALPPDVMKVGLLVDDSDDRIAAILARAPLDLLQLHGRETPERVAAIKRRFGVPVMKVVKIAAPTDLAVADLYFDRADWLLFDAKSPPQMTGALPGGNALAFDWQLLAGRSWPLPWMLSGGLTADNLAEAVRISGARAVDVSSGVESRPGQKDPARIASFLAAAARL